MGKGDWLETRRRHNRSIDTSAAETMPGVKATWIDKDLVGEDIYIGQVLAAVAADTEERATEALESRSHLQSR